MTLKENLTRISKGDKYSRLERALAREALSLHEAKIRADNLASVVEKQYEKIDARSGDIVGTRAAVISIALQSAVYKYWGK